MAFSQISTNSIEQIIQKLKLQKYRDSTRNNYYTIWKLFNRFFVRLDRKPSSWEKRIQLFVGYLIENKKQSSTVKSYISAICAVLQDNDIKLDEDLFLINSSMKACRLVNDKVRTSLPIQWTMLNVLVDQVDQYYRKVINQPFLRILYRCLFLTTYFGLFRVGEVMLAPGKHAVLARDVHIARHKNKISFILRTSKTHSCGSKPQDY